MEEIDNRSEEEILAEINTNAIEVQDEGENLEDVKEGE